MYELDVQKLESFYEPGSTVAYYLPYGDQFIHLNPFIGQAVKIRYKGSITCIHCGRKTKKSFNQGYCFPCARSLPQTDLCIVRPQTCSYFDGGCRDPEWGEKHCMIRHTVYLANSSGIKVGITRHENRFNRWVDQGAIAAIPIATVNKRIDAGKVEVALATTLADKTNWRKMLSKDVKEIDLHTAKSAALDLIPADISHEISEEPVYRFKYPVREFPEKIKSYNLDKTPEVEDILLGIKGQYLIFKNAVINFRKFSGYAIEFSSPDQRVVPISSKPSSVGSSSAASSISSAD